MRGARLWSVAALGVMCRRALGVAALGTVGSFSCVRCEDGVHSLYPRIDLLTAAQQHSMQVAVRKMWDLLHGKESRHVRDNKFLETFFVSCTMWRNMDPADIPSHFGQLLSYRQSLGIDTIRQDWKPSSLAQLQQILPLGLHHAKAKNGGVVYIERPGFADVWAAVQFSSHEIMQLKITHFEELSDRVAQSGFRPITLVIDLSGLCWAACYPPALWRAHAVVDVMQRAYSDGHGIPGSCIFIVNAPRIFETVWEMVRPWLRQHLQQLVVVSSNDYERLHDGIVEPAALPISLGGEMDATSEVGAAYTTLSPHVEL